MYDATLLSIQYHLFSIMSGHFLNVNNVKKPPESFDFSSLSGGLSNSSQMLNRTSDPGGSTMKFSAA